MYGLVRKPSMGDAAVDGLLVGMGAGLCMLLYLALAALWQGDRIGVLLRALNRSGSVSPLQGLLTHFAISGVSGVLWGLAVALLLPHLRLPLWLWGLAYGVALALFAHTASSANTPLAAWPAGLLAAAHLVYGLALGLIQARACPTSGR